MDAAELGFCRRSEQHRTRSRRGWKRQTAFLTGVLRVGRGRLQVVGLQGHPVDQKVCRPSRDLAITWEKFAYRALSILVMQLN